MVVGYRSIAIAGRTTVQARSVSVESAGPKYRQNISVGPHTLNADEPAEWGGSDIGPNPYELLLAALGACTSITVRMFAERKRWPLQNILVDLSHAQVHAHDSAGTDQKPRMIDRVETTITLSGALTEEQRRGLLEIAGKCPVHCTLTSQVEILTHAMFDEPHP
jgi:uncharacterized OsmC-like protein